MWPPSGRPGAPTSPNRWPRPSWPRAPGRTASPSTCAADRRHIQERDARLLKEVLAIPLNVECAATAEGLEAVVPVKPAWVTLVPETREEPTTQGGLDVVFLHAHLRQVIRELHASQIRVSLFVDPQPDQLKMAAKLEADAVEFNTGRLRRPGPRRPIPRTELGRLREAARLGSRLGLKVLAGHGLNLQNVGADRRHPGDRGAEHRPQHRRPGRAGGHGAGGPGDAGGPPGKPAMTEIRRTPPGAG